MPGKIKIFLLLFLTPLFIKAQNFYWVGFADKNGSPYSIENPSAFLSEKAIERRLKQDIPVDELDLPITKSYINEVVNLGATFIHSSKWLNGITVKSGEPDFIIKALNLPFVNEVQLTKPEQAAKSIRNKFRNLGSSESEPSIDTSFYGQSVYQVGQLNGQYLHKKNNFGQGKVIAVLDAGFYMADYYPAFERLRTNGQILGTRDFVNPESNIYMEHYHGMSVLSIMGGYIPGQLIGTAPDASYWLIRSEDSSSEFLIEEDNWVAAAEFADSVGADVINSSLGYYLFDDSSMDHTYSEMDGNTTRVTRGANIAASRGMVVVVSAGNEGNDIWKYIIAPSDGDKVIGVAAVDRYGEPAYFTSYGPASDGDVKPNVAAIGYQTVIQRSTGTISTGNGTSYSGPVIAGMAACLWQANPEATAVEVKEGIEKSANLYNLPDSLLGFGIPDFQVADQIIKFSRTNTIHANSKWMAYPNPFNDKVILYQQGEIIPGEIQFAFRDVSGRLYQEQKFMSNSLIVVNGLSDLPSGIIILQIITDGEIYSLKLIKTG